jgi:hypothetical protein
MPAPASRGRASGWWHRAHLIERVLHHDLHLTDEFFICQSGLHEETGPLLRLLVLLVAGEEMTISSLLKEPAVVDAEGPGERGRRRQDLPDEELPPRPPAGAKNDNFGIAAGLGDGEGDGARGGGTRGLNSRGEARAKGWSTHFNAAQQPELVS